MTRVVKRKMRKIGDGKDGKYIGRPSIFGNPFDVATYGRPRALRLYLWYFYARLDMDPTFRAAVETLRGETLVCWCAPQPCHGDVIARYLDEGPLLWSSSNAN